MKLSDHASDTYSQFGEDGMIAALISEIPQRIKGVCVEFGASDGPEGSSVGRLWSELRWKALLIEADPERHERLKNNVGNTVTVVRERVTPFGPGAIDNILAEQGIVHIDVMSIDVDGNDYLIWKEMKARPSIICIEFNPTIPPHISLHQEYSPDPIGFGSSVKALVELGQEKGYMFVGASHCNALFVESGLAIFYQKYERDLAKLFDPTQYSYLITDYLGQAVATKKPPFGIRLPYRGPDLIGDEVSYLADSVHETIFSVFDSPQQTMGFYEAKYGKRSVRWEPNSGLYNIADPNEPAEAQMRAYLEAGRSPVLIDIVNISNLDDIQWIYRAAKDYGYAQRTGGGIILLVKGEL